MDSEVNFDCITATEEFELGQVFQLNANVSIPRYVFNNHTRHNSKAVFEVTKRDVR